MVDITFVTPDGTEISIEGQTGLSLMEAARNADVPGIIAECGGSCSCSTCHVYVDPAWIEKLPSTQNPEADLLDFAFEPDPDRSRLSCQIILSDALNGLRVTVPAQQG